jgi:hypothetical protein
LYKFLQDNKMLFEFQSGLLDYIQCTSNNTKSLYTGMIMLDLQKAFDMVDHNILCSKLNVMGVNSVEWFRSYVSDLFSL